MTEFKKMRKAEIVQQLLRFPFLSLIIRQWGPKHSFLLKYLEMDIFIDGWFIESWWQEKKRHHTGRATCN